MKPLPILAAAVGALLLAAGPTEAAAAASPTVDPGDTVSSGVVGCPTCDPGSTVTAGAGWCPSCAGAWPWVGRPGR